MPPVTQALLIVNVLVFFVVQQLGPTIIVQFGLWPWATELFRPWQVVSYAFLHGSLTHLAFNMFG
ncbi:MAG: rhomboid family intramembrane serine protease, partial [Rhodoferax sp.]|nr:rhomboid family intramembrane serine protease [Rhodoferax sp.]